MTKCLECNKEMLKPTTKLCSCKHIILDGKSYLRDTEQYDLNVRCHDCNIINQKGNLHHYGCDMERCPKCKGQLISCDCKKGEVY